MLSIYLLLLIRITKVNFGLESYLMSRIKHQKQCINVKPVSLYSRQLVRLNNTPVMGSSPKQTVPPYVGLTILLWGEINKLLKAKPKSGRQALIDNGC